MTEFWPNLIRTLRDVKEISPTGKIGANQRAYLTASKNAILRGAKRSSDDVRKVIGVYDKAYANLIERQDPKMFREFLLSAPSLFVEIGEKLGAMSHIASFWQYRFPPGAPRSVDADELIAIFQDFVKALPWKILPPSKSFSPFPPAAAGARRLSCATPGNAALRIYAAALSLYHFG